MSIAARRVEHRISGGRRFSRIGEPEHVAARQGRFTRYLFDVHIDRCVLGLPGRFRETRWRLLVGSGFVVIEVIGVVVGDRADLGGPAPFIALSHTSVVAERVVARYDESPG